MLSRSDLIPPPGQSCRRFLQVIMPRPPNILLGRKLSPPNIENMATKSTAFFLQNWSESGRDSPTRSFAWNGLVCSASWKEMTHLPPTSSRKPERSCFGSYANKLPWGRKRTSWLLTVTDAETGPSGRVGMRNKDRYQQMFFSLGEGPWSRRQTRSPSLRDSQELRRQNSIRTRCDSIAAWRLQFAGRVLNLFKSHDESSNIWSCRRALHCLYGVLFCFDLLWCFRV